MVQQRHRPGWKEAIKWAFMILLIGVLAIIGGMNPTNQIPFFFIMGIFVVLVRSVVRSFRKMNSEDQEH